MLVFIWVGVSLEDSAMGTIQVVCMPGYTTLLLAYDVDEYIDLPCRDWKN